MNDNIEIYGSSITIQYDDYVEDWGYPNEPKKQKWYRKELPDFFDDVKKDDDGNAILNEEQSLYAQEEVRRCKQGFTFLNNGKKVKITGKNYFYLTYWKLEDDVYPDFRLSDAYYFLYLDYWEHILWCLGILRGKKRREGASSQATSNLIYECIFFTNSNCGLVSKTQIDSRDTFTDMAAFGYQQLPIFLKPRQLNREGSVTELVFAAKIDKKNNNSKGLRSKINYRAPVLNAYDRGRISRILGDEGGKWPLDVPFSKFLAIVSKTLVKGAKRVGFGEFPSTVNEMTKGGGMQYKIAWDGANQFKSGGKKTPNRCVTYFTPAFDNYEGFIDEFGMSVIDKPTPEQYEYLVKRWVVKDPITGDTVSEINEDDIKQGARAYVLSRRIGLVGELLEEEIRMNPCTVDEMFEAANTGCTFNSFNIHKRRKEIEENEPYKRNVLFYRDLDQTVKWRDITKADSNFYWSITQLLDVSESNKFNSDGRYRTPSRTDDGAISVDSYSNSQGGRKYGSKASAWIGRKFDILDPKNTGKSIGHLYGRPAVKETLHEQVMLAAEYYGYKVWYEHTADDYLSYFRERGKIGYLGTYPLSLIDPTKRADADRYKGTPITPFSLTKQLDYGIAYFENHCDNIDFIELLDNALLFDPYDRTKYDCLVSFLILLAVLLEPSAKPPAKKNPLVKVYSNPRYAAAT
jgi:hypothetical protein